MNRRLVLVGFLVAAFSGMALAQFNIRVPKIPKPTPKPTTSTSSSKPASGAEVAAKEGAAIAVSAALDMKMDDGYTFFDAEPVKGRNAKNTGDIDVGWYLKPQLRVMGTFPNNSGFRVVVSKGGKELSRFFCNAWVFRKADDVEVKIKKRSYFFPDYMMTRSCNGETAPIKEIGRVDVSIYTVDGNTDEEKLIRKHSAEVRKLPVLSGPAKSPEPRVSNYFIQRYEETPFAIVRVGGTYLSVSNDSRARPYNLNWAPGGPSGKLSVYFPMVPERRSTRINTYLRCSVNGAPLKLDYDAVETDVRGQGGGFSEFALTSRSNPSYSESIDFKHILSILPLAVGKEGNLFDVSTKPGDYDCKIMENGEVIRGFSFKVGGDGFLVEHPEQQSGNVNLYSGSYLSEAMIPAGGSSFDSRLMPTSTGTIFYGIPLNSPALRSAGSKVPKKGNPYPAMPK
ncbi:MAG: hypothetical protein R2684_11900 [Pyrinomonadaceae bacterium]